MKRILLMVILLSVPLCAQTPEAKSTPAAQQSITVSKLPPVTIAKDGIDWSVLANYLLVAVGVGGIAVAVWTLCYIRQQVNEMRRQRKLMLGTLKAIQAQAWHMERQTKILEDSVTAAQISANAADISAKTAMGVAVPTLMLHEFAFSPRGAASLEAWLQFPRVRIAVKNYGQSPAIMKFYAVEFTCDEPPYDVLSDSHILYFDAGTAVESGEKFTLEELGVCSWGEFSEEDRHAILTGSKALAVYGSVWYDDVFGSPTRKLTFCKVGHEFSPDGNAIWIDWPSPYAKGERNPN